MNNIKKKLSLPRKSVLYATDKIYKLKRLIDKYLNIYILK